jgi:SPP1 family predicted phage head-tail adaptor
MMAGRLRHRIMVEQKTKSRGATGEETVIWSTLVTRWAEIKPMTGKELYAAAIQIEGKITHLIRIRYDAETAAITPNMRVNYGGRYFNIEAALNVFEQDKEIHLIGVEDV